MQKKRLRSSFQDTWDERRPGNDNYFQCPLRPSMRMMLVNLALKNISTTWKNQSAVAWNQRSIAIFWVQLPDLEMLAFILWMKWKKWPFVGTACLNQLILCYPAIVREVAEIVTALPPTQGSVELLFSAVRRVITRGDKGERFPGHRISMISRAPNDCGGPKSPNNVTSTFFNTVH